MALPKGEAESPAGAETANGPSMARGPRLGPIGEAARLRQPGRVGPRNITGSRCSKKVRASVKMVRQFPAVDFPLHHFVNITEEI